MRVLVVAPAPGLGGRLGPAAAALALRGHEVTWLGAASPLALPREITVVASAGGLGRTRADVVVGDGRRVARVALAGWRAGAHAMVIDLSAEAVTRWVVL